MITADAQSTGGAGQKQQILAMAAYEDDGDEQHCKFVD